MGDNMNIIDNLWNPFIDNFGFIFTAISLVIAILERRARINAEKKQAELETKYNNLNNYIERVSLDEELIKDIDRLQSEKGELEQQRDNLKKTIPEMAKESFAKYGFDLYKNQLIEDFKKYNQFKSMYNNNSTEGIPDDLIQEIEGLSSAKRNMGDITGAMIHIIGVILIYLILRDIFSIPFLSVLSFVLCISPLIEIMNYFNPDNDWSLTDIIDGFVFSLFQLVIAIASVLFLNVFQFLIADQISLVSAHLQLIRFIVTIVIIVLICWGVNSYKNTLKYVFEINDKTYSTLWICLLFISFILISLGAFLIYNSEVNIGDFSYFLNAKYDDYFVVGITLVIYGVIGIIGDIWSFKGNKVSNKV